MLDPLYGLPPGRRVHAQARALRRVKRRHQLKGVAAISRSQENATVLQFPTSKKEVPDAPHQNDQA